MADSVFEGMVGSYGIGEFKMQNSKCKASVRHRVTADHSAFSADDYRANNATELLAFVAQPIQFNRRSESKSRTDPDPVNAFTGLSQRDLQELQELAL